jgi:fatty acid desaturase
MKENFHTSQILSTEQLEDLSNRKNRPALLRFTITYLAFILINILAVATWTSSWGYLVLAQVGYAIVCCGMFAALHETGHGTAFASRDANKITALLAGLAHVYTPSMFRALHFTHHRYTHIPGKDPEISLGNRPVPSILSNISTYLSWLTGLPLLLFKFFMVISGALGMPKFLREQLFPFVRPSQRKWIFIESILFLTVYAIVIYMALVVDVRFMGIIVGQIVGHCLLAFYVSMEHNGLGHDGNIFDRTRSMKVFRIVRLIMWNMPYHAEHHAFPSVPFHALPALHQAIEAEIVYKDKSHIDFHRSNFYNLLKW